MEGIIAELEKARVACTARCPGEPALMILAGEIPLATIAGRQYCFISFNKLIEEMKQQCLSA